MPAARSLGQPVQDTLKRIFADQMVIGLRPIDQPVKDTLQSISNDQMVIDSLSTLFSGMDQGSDFMSDFMSDFICDFGAMPALPRPVPSCSAPGSGTHPSLAFAVLCRPPLAVPPAPFGPFLARAAAANVNPRTRLSHVTGFLPLLGS